MFNFHANSGVARAFPGGQAAHSEDQNEEENEENLRKNEGTTGKWVKKKKRKCSYLAHLGVRGWLRPCMLKLEMNKGRNLPGGATWAIYVVITDQNFAVKGCPFQHRPRPAGREKGLNFTVFWKKRVPFYNGYVGVLGSDFEKSSRKSSMTDFGQHVFTIAPSYFLGSYLVSHQD